MENNQNTTNPKKQNVSAENQEVPFNGSLKPQQNANPYMPASGQMQQGAPQPQQMPHGNYMPYGNQPNSQNGAPYNPQQMPPQQYQQMPAQRQQQVAPQPQMQPGMASNQSDSAAKQDGKKAAHAKKAQSAFIQRSSRMRKLYVVIIILLVIAAIAIGFLAFQMIRTADNSATQQTQVTSTDITEVGEGNDTKDNDTPKTTVPNLVELLGKTRKQAIEMIGHGAEVASEKKVKERGNPIRRELRVVLTDEPSDSRSGAPTVYLSLNKDGKVIHCGYSVSTSSLGYGSASFSDTVESEHIVENTLGEAGLNVELGSAVLPKDATKYSSYSSDGSTVTKEYYSFSGKGKANGKTYDWEAMLSYDYTVANASENLNDTLRTIFVYVS